MPMSASAPMTKPTAASGITRTRPFSSSHVAQVGALVDHADQREHQAGHHAAGEQLEAGAVQAELVQGGDAEQHQAQVADR